MDTSVIVIGAGVAGLTCARSLADSGVKAVVLEARDRIGGRILTDRPDGEDPIELGAQVIHGERAASWPLLEAAGLGCRPLEASGEFAVLIEGRWFPMSLLLAAGVAPPWELEDGLGRSTVRPGDSVADVFDARGMRGVERSVADEWLTQAWGISPADLGGSELVALNGASTAGSGEFVVEEGYDRLPAHLAEGLDVHVGRPVSTVRWAPGKVLVESGDMILAARAAVITAPPTTVRSGALRLVPEVPAKQAAARRLLYGDAIVLAVSLSSAAPEDTWAISVGAQGGYWRARAGSRRLTGLIKGPAARAAREMEITPAAIANLTQHAIGWLDDVGIERVELVDWGNDPYAGGAYCAPAPGSLDAAATWSSAVEATLFFAGDAACPERHLGMVHGSIESGLRAAAQVEKIFGREPRDQSGS